MKRTAIVIVTALVGALATAAIVQASRGPAKTTPPPAKVGLRTTTLGRILVDRAGRTLYLFEKDRNGRSSCSGACAQAWPPVTTTGTPVAGAGVSRSKLGTVRRSSGKRQVTYNGHPLYRYVGDSRPGNTNGQGSNAFGAGWYVMSAAGRKIDSDR
jgi:predicted lipoprotein with Yx(FWY)xxD motif